MGIFARKNHRDSAATLNNEPGYAPNAGQGMSHTTTATHTSPREAGRVNNNNSGGGFFHRSTASADSASSNEMRDMRGSNGINYDDDQSSGRFGRGGGNNNGNGMGLGNAGTGGTSINFSLEQARNKLARAQEHERVADQALLQSRTSVKEARQEISALEREARINLDQATKMKKAGSKLGKY